MNYITLVIVIFSLIGGIDRIFGNRFGLGKEFEKAFMLLGAMALSMIGMIVISPLIANLMQPVSTFFSEILHLDASVIPASLFANDMGGASLATEMASDKTIGMYNALVVSSMMGCTVSFTIPFSLGVVKKEQQRELLLGILCGVATISPGCFVSGLVLKIPFLQLILNLLPLILFSGILVCGLVYAADLCIKIFRVFGYVITAIITIGLVLGMIKFLTGVEIVKGLETVEEGALICLNAAIVLSGAFPFMFIITKIFSKPLGRAGKLMGINENSVAGLISALVTSATTFGLMEKMDKKGAVLNSAFAVSGAFSLGSHLAFTMAYESSYVLPVIIGKLVAGVFAVVLAIVIYKK